MLNRLRRLIRWLYWAIDGPDFTALQPGDPQELFDAATELWVSRRPG